jgi:L-2-hydroxyglutarate oxidase LhgO
MKQLTQVPAPFPELHFMQYNARSSRVQERHQEQIAGLAKMSLASSDDKLPQLKRRYNRTKANVSVNTGW